MPASWSPSNCVTLPEQPASLASFGSPNHSPRWRVCTGSNFGFFSASNLSTCGAFTLPGANTNNSSPKMPMARTSPWPWLLVVKSAWYQETPKGLLGDEQLELRVLWRMVESDVHDLEARTRGVDVHVGFGPFEAFVVHGRLGAHHLEGGVVHSKGRRGC